MTLLLIDTAFDCCQVGLWRDGHLIAQQSMQGEARHDVVLAPLVADLLQQNDLTVKDLSGVAAVTGPGRFTSLRVGIAYARALVLPYQTPIVGVATGEILNRIVTTANPAWLVMVKRGEVFAQTPMIAEPQMVPLEAVAGWLAEQGIDHVTVIGAGVPTVWDDALPPSMARTILTTLPLEALGAVAQDGMDKPPVPVRPFYGLSTGAGT